MSSTVYDCILGGLTVRQVSNTRYTPRNKVRVARLSGQIDPNTFFLENGQPRAVIDSYDIAGVVAGLTSLQAGLAVDAGTIVLPFNVRTNGGGFASGTSHDQIAGTNALILPRSFMASQTSPAVSQLEVIFLSSDGDTAPITISQGVALGSQAFNAEYRMGPVTIGGTGVGEVERISIMPGIQEVVLIQDGFAWPTKAFIVTRDPYIDLTFRTFASMALFANGFSGTAAFAAYFRKNAAGSTYAAVGGGNHIKWSFAGGCRDLEDVSAREEANGQATARLWGDSLSYSATSTIP